LDGRKNEAGEKMKIYLIRHGQSEGNVDPQIYSVLKDHNVPLTDKGREQAKEAGINLSKKIIKSKKTVVFVSPYLRTRQSWEEIRLGLDSKKIKYTEEENPLLREQEYKVFTNQQEAEETHGERLVFGPFWYRFKNAESIADVYQRLQIFINMLHLRKNSKKLPPQVVIVAHEIVIRIIIMILTNKRVEDSDLKIDNGEIVVLDNKKIKYF
jgi:broad specificity phosphatase PhoE